MNKIRVCVSALWFPFTMAHFFWRAFERRDDIELFVLGPFTDDYIPWNYGIRLPREYVKIPDYALPASAAQTRVPAEFVQPKLPWKPDLWLQVDAGWHLQTKPDAGIVGLIETDPHVLKGLYQLPKSYSDITWCMQTPYMEEGDIFLPYGYDPEIHFPEEKEKIYDACLIGLHYETRDKLVARLRSRGLNVYYSIGEIYSDYRHKYCESKIALSWSSLLDTPARVFESMAMGLPLVANRTPDLMHMFQDGVHYLGFDTLDEAEKQVMRLLVDDDLRERISQNGFDGVQGNSWDNRVDQILRDSKLI